MASPEGDEKLHSTETWQDSNYLLRGGEGRGGSSLSCPHAPGLLSSPAACLESQGWWEGKGVLLGDLERRWGQRAGGACGVKDEASSERLRGEEIHVN